MSRRDLEEQIAQLQTQLTEQGEQAREERESALEQVKSEQIAEVERLNRELVGLKAGADNIVQLPPPHPHGTGELFRVGDHPERPDTIKDSRQIPFPPGHPQYTGPAQLEGQPTAGSKEELEAILANALAKIDTTQAAPAPAEE